MLADLRLAVRRLRRAPSFATVAVLTLALGLAATTAVWSLLDAVALRPLPYPAAERLVVLEHAVPGVPQTGAWGISKANYFYYARSWGLERVAIYATSGAVLEGAGRAEQVPAVYGSPSLFALLGARAQQGRLFGDGDVPREREAPRVAVLSDGLWRGRFGADPAVVGRTLRVDGDPVTVVGVMAPVQTPTIWDGGGQLWVPMALDSAAPAQNAHMRHGLARLRPGVTPAVAERELRAMATRLPERFPGVYTRSFMERTGFRPRVTELRASVVGGAARVLWLTFGGAALVLAVAAANVANLLLVRREGQRRELAVRRALGAGRARLVRDAAAEVAALALAAALLALPLAAAAVRVARALAPEGLPLLDTARVDWRAGAACVGAALLVAAAVGVLPRLRAAPQADALREGGRGATVGRRRLAARHALVVGQTALALVLLSGAGLLVESVRRLRAVPPGFAVADVLTASVAMSATGETTDARALAFWRALEVRLAALPGVVAAGATERLPLTSLGGGGGCTGVVIEGEAAGEREAGPCVATARATPGFFRAMGIAVRGTAPAWGATDAGTAGVVVTEELAARLWPGREALGRGLRSSEANGARRPGMPRVRGFAVGLRDRGVDVPPPELAYFPVTAPAGDTTPGSVPRGMAVVLRTAGADPATYADALRRAVAELDPGAAIGVVRPMRELYAASMARVAFTTALLGAAAGTAVLLAAVGLYGALAYLVGLRARELGVRMALGARAGQVGALVVAQSARLAGAGVALGGMGALATSRALRSLLFGVAPGDPAVLGAAAALLVAVAALASWVPARRATRVDPASALRAE